MQEMWVWYLGQKDPLEEEMATHSSILAWEIPWREKPCGLQSIIFQRVRHHWAWAHTHTQMPKGISPNENMITYLIYELCMCSQSCPTFCNPVDYSPPDLLCPWNFPGKSTGVGCHFLLQGRDWTHISCVSCIGMQILYHCATQAISTSSNWKKQNRTEEAF